MRRVNGQFEGAERIHEDNWPSWRRAEGKLVGALLMGPVAVRRPERESATVWLTLQGGRKVSAQRLGRWPETVKVLRRNLYHPLGGATHAELFALFLQQSGEPDAAARLNPA